MPEFNEDTRFFNPHREGVETVRVTHKCTGCGTLYTQKEINEKLLITHDYRSIQGHMIPKCHTPGCIMGCIKPLSEIRSSKRNKE